MAHYKNIESSTFASLSNSLQNRVSDIYKKKNKNDVENYAEFLEDIEQIIEDLENLFHFKDNEESTLTPIIESDNIKKDNKSNELKFIGKNNNNDDNIFSDLKNTTKNKKNKKNKKINKSNKNTDITNIIMTHNNEEEKQKVLKELFFVKISKAPIISFNSRTNAREASIEIILWALKTRFDILIERFNRRVYNGKTWHWFTELIDESEKINKKLSKLVENVSIKTGKYDEIIKIENEEKEKRDHFREQRRKLNRGELYREEKEKYDKLKSENQELFKNGEISGDELSTFEEKWEERLTSLKNGFIPRTKDFDGRKSYFQKKAEAKGGYIVPNNVSNEDTKKEIKPQKKIYQPLKQFGLNKKSDNKSLTNNDFPTTIGSSTIAEKSVSTKNYATLFKE